MVRSKKEELREWRVKLTAATDSYEQIQRRLKGLYARKAQVYQDQRRDLAAIQAVNDEEESLLMLEQSRLFDLENCQQKERECFESLSDAIQESHEKERANTDQMKYYSRLGSLMGAVFGFLGSNLFLRREIRQHNLRQAEKMEVIESAMLELEQTHKQKNPATMNTSDSGGIASSSQYNTKHSIQGVEKTLKQAETKIDELSAEMKRNATILEKICMHLRLQVPSATTVPKPSQQHSSRDSQKSDMVALAGVVSYSVLLALLSLHR